jgi:hypothetical protein
MYGSKGHGSNRRGLGVNRSTQFGHLLSVRARTCLQLQHTAVNISRGATARAKRIPAGPHTRSSDLRDDAVERTEQCGDASVLCLERKVAHPKWHGQSRWTSQCVQQPTANLVDFPLRIVRQLRNEFVCSMQFLDRVPCPVQELH